jgi:uncharacterized protein Yka (UPF0111/DUF47 family)
MQHSMFSLQKLLGQEEKIFKLLEASAEEARNSVQALVKISKSLNDTLVLDEFARLRQLDKKITQEITSAAYTVFVTSLDREDIDALSSALYKVPKMVDKFTERLLLSPTGVRAVNFSPQIELLEEATDVVVEMVRTLRKENLRQINHLDDQLQSVEVQADEQMLELHRELFNRPRDILEIIALKDLYEQLEKVIDRCRDAGSMIARVALKTF